MKVPTATFVSDARLPSASLRLWQSALVTPKHALSGVADAVACDGCPPLARLFGQFAEGGGELLVCPICFNSKKLDQTQLVGNARLAGATPLWQWIGEGSATVFSY